MNRYDEITNLIRVLEEEDKKTPNISKDYLKAINVAINTLVDLRRFY